MPKWIALLSPANTILVKPLSEVCSDGDRDPTSQTVAALALAAIKMPERP